MTNIIKYSPRIVGELLNIVNSAIFLLDRGQRIIFANSQMEKMFKSNDSKMIGSSFEELFMPEDRKIMASNILKLTKEKHEFECEAKLYCADGSSFFGLLSCSFFTLDEEEFIATTIHDITKMKSIERMLKHSEHEAFLGHMLDDISHQILNPVVAIAGLAKRMKKEDSSEKYCKIITQESHRLEVLLNTLNAFIHLPRPKLELVSLSKLVEAARPEVELFTEEFDFIVEWKYSEKVLVHKILVDVSLLVKAVKAVVLNACESYAFNKKSENQKVILQVRETFDPVYPYALSIIDQGSGIASDDLPFVASHFFTKKGRHMGMGLTFAQRILEEQGGEMHIESTEGRGTTVTFFLKKERRRPIRLHKL